MYTKIVQINKRSSVCYKISRKLENKIEGQGQWSPKVICAKMHFRRNLANLASIGVELSCEQAQNGKLWLLSSTSPLRSMSMDPKTIGIYTKVLCTCGPNLVILAWPSDKISHWQAGDWLHTETHKHTHSQTQAMTIAEKQNWPWVKSLNI